MLQKIGRRLSSFIKGNRGEVVILVMIILVAGVCRLWRIADYMTFLGDEGRDVTVVRRLLVDGDIVLVGPTTSIGNMYLGPLYYYLIAPALAVAGLSPVGPAVMVAILGVVTVGLVWWVGREWFGKLAGLAAAGLYAISPVVIVYSRSSWNPNIMPLFALVVIYGIWRVWQRQEWKWLGVMGVAMGVVLQSHYLGLLLLPTLAIFGWLSWRGARREERKEFWKWGLVGLGLFVILMSPIVIFDARHGWRNAVAIEKFFTVRQETVNIKPWKSLGKFWPLVEQVDTRLVAGKDEGWGRWVAIAGMVATVGLVLVTKRRAAVGLLLAWYVVGVLGLGLYKQHIYDHYFGFMFPAPFLFAGFILEEISERVNSNILVYYDWRVRWGAIVVAVVLAGLVWLGLKENPLKYPPNMQLAHAMEISGKVTEEARGRPFNFALIAKQNYEPGYTYFFEKWGAPWRGIDPQRYEETVADRLFVVCEGECEPVTSPKVEVANFGWSKIEASWQFGWGVKLYKLSHVKEKR